jgi:CBS domain-containing protein
MQTAKHLLQHKGFQIWSVSPNASVYEALEVMADKNIGAVLVMEHGELLGILSERDYARKVILRGRLSRDTQVREIMTTHVVCARAEQTVEECMALMTNRRIRHLPVLEDGRLIGVISIGDVVREIIAEREFVIEQLENYISGKVV